jgi:hypothetical protein
MKIGNDEAVTRKAADRAGLAGPLGAWVQRIFRDRFPRMGKAGLDRRLKLVETLQLGGKCQLMLILCDGRPVLIGAGGDSIQSMVEIQQNPPVSSASIALNGASPGYERGGAIECLGQEAACQ